ncbi:hypothetical protein [Peribacillus frigoritolerans]|uniref:hypothetical protein n=1 Tax=Peribacillus frigoritolerans TaxID=450367 RepID=UPI002E24601E|nr:hypothetical protein [Peribacillus frigoritolerans]
MKIELILEYLKLFNFTHYNETVTEIEYQSGITKVKLNEFLTKFSEEIFKKQFRISLQDASDNANFSIPTEQSDFEDNIEFFNDTLTCTIRFKKRDFVEEEFKQKYNVIVYSSQDKLLKEMKKLSIVKLESFLFQQLDKYTILYVFSSANEMFFSNGWVTITSDLHRTEESLSVDIGTELKKIKDRNENIHWVSENTNIPPSALYFAQENRTQESELIDYFNICCIKVCLGFIAAYTEFKSDTNSYYSTFKGLRHVNFKVEYSGPLDKVKYLYDLYSWIYSEKPTDKIALTQNVISLYINKEHSDDVAPLLNNIDDIFLAIKENYKVYIDKSMDKYLNERKQLEEFVRNTTNEIEKQVNSITSLMTSNMFGILAAGITAILGFSQRTDNNLLLSIILYVYGGFVILLTAYYYIYAKNNIKLKKDNYDNRIIEYKKIFFDERINEIAGKNVEVQMKIYKQYSIATWIINISISLTAIFVGIYLQHNFNLIKWLLKHL